MSKTLAIALFLFSITGAALTGCNTVAGAGEDLEGASRSTEKAMDKAVDGDK